MKVSTLGKVLKMKEESNNKQYYRVQANVDLNAIRHNIGEVRSKITKGTKLMVIMKADAYGHGAARVAKAIDDYGADAYGVAIVEEAVELRKAGITKPILVLGYTAKQLYRDIVKYDVTQTIFQYETAKALSGEALRQGKTAKIHIKLDTGMSRIGFSDTEESLETIKRISGLAGIEIEGLFSHFARADEEERSHTLKQLKRYMDFAGRLEAEGIHIPVKHIANSAGILEFPAANLDMVRCGISTYGIYPSEFVNHEELRLIPAMELKTHVIYVKEVEAGVGVSYNATYVTGRKTKIATIPVGYGDGYSRNLSNCGRVIINGQYAPIIGKVCMDQFMVDVSELKDVKQDDTVTLLGRDGDAYISTEELAKLSHSFPYELICNVGKRIPRVYTD